MSRALGALIILMILVAGFTTLATDELSAQNGGGLWLLPNTERARIENHARQERLHIENQAAADAAQLHADTARSMMPTLLAERAAISAIVCLFMGGMAYAGVLYARRMATTVLIRPDRTGLFPQMILSVGGAKIIHDGNRSLTATTVYAPSRLSQSVTVIPVQSDASPAQLRAALAGAFIQASSAALTSTRPSRRLIGNNTQALPADSSDTAWPAHIALHDLLDGDQPSLARLILGITMDSGHQEVVTGDMFDLVHVAVGGSSGWGKSKFMQSLAYQVALSRSADMALIDLEGVTFALFGQCDELLYPVADTEQSALAVLQALQGEIERRKALFSACPGVESLSDYNKMASDRLRPVVTLIDESTALLDDKGVEGAMGQIALRGRKYGLWLVAGGQDWKASSLDTRIRNQLSTRVQFRALSASQSRVLLGQGGAEGLEVPGRCLAVLPGRGMVKLQAAHIGRNEIEAAINGNGPVSALPAAAEKISSDADRVRILAAQGMSLSEIARRVYGSSGGASFYRVKDILASTTTTS